MPKQRSGYPTIADVARECGVGSMTVSRVVNDTGRVSSTRRTKVMMAIQDLQYRPNAHASELGRANSGIPKKRAAHVHVG